MTKSSVMGVRGRLLEAGVATFSRAGFNGCSVQDITDAAGVPKGSFYNHFESKEALGAAALEHYWKDGGCDTLKLLHDPDRAPLERLKVYFTQVTADLVAADYVCGCLIGNMTAEMSDHSALVSAQLSAIYASWTWQVADCIAQAQEAGEIKSDAKPEALAAFVLNAWEGAVLRARIEKGNGPLEQFNEMLFTYFLR
jgi:TetR/AcrR family transcriptional regulator, transcriptional repressor for nem operon